MLCRKLFSFFFLITRVNMLFKYRAAGIDMDLHPPHNSHQMFTIKYVWASPVQPCELYLPQVPTPSQQKSWRPIREQRQSLHLIIPISSHLILDIRRQNLPPGHSWLVSKKKKKLCLSQPHFFSRLMQFFSGTSANSGGSGFAVLCVDNSAFACSCGDADAVRTSTSFSEHHCWTRNHSKECPLCQRSPQGWCAEIFHTDQPG